MLRNFVLVRRMSRFSQGDCAIPEGLDGVVAARRCTVTSSRVQEPVLRSTSARPTRWMLMFELSSGEDCRRPIQLRASRLHAEARGERRHARLPCGLANRWTKLSRKPLLVTGAVGGSGASSISRASAAAAQVLRINFDRGPTSRPCSCGCWQ